MQHVFKTLAEYWQGYRSMVVKEGTSVFQVEDTEGAFYAGAMALFSLCTEQAPEGEAEMDAHLEGLDTEMGEFFHKHIARLKARPEVSVESVSVTANRKTGMVYLSPVGGEPMGMPPGGAAALAAALVNAADIAQGKEPSIEMNVGTTSTVH